MPVTQSFAVSREAQWDEFVARHPCGHFLQCWGWGRLREAWGWQAHRLAVGDERGAPLAGAQVLVRRSIAGNLAYVPRGPVCLPRDAVWSELQSAVRQAVPGLVAVRYEPHWADDSATRSWLRRQGLRPAWPVQPPSTRRIDLVASEEQLLAAMKQKWRYNIRLAQRRGVQVRLGGPGDLDTFCALLQETA